MGRDGMGWVEKLDEGHDLLYCILQLYSLLLHGFLKLTRSWGDRSGWAAKKKSSTVSFA